MFFSEMSGFREISIKTFWRIFKSTGSGDSESLCTLLGGLC